MHYEQPYYISHPPPQPSRRVRPRDVRQNTTLRYCLFGSFGVCCLLVFIALITLFVVYFIRYQNTISSYLSYPDFVCSQRPCGCPNYLSGKVLGGKETLPYTYPWLVALVNRETMDSFCSGFIVSSNAILTAAHCIQGRNPYLVQILGKVHDLRQFNGERYDIDQWFIHPEYRSNDTMHLNDIAMIKIKNSFGNELQSLCLPSIPSSIYPREKTKAVISGWGKSTISSNSRNSPVLQHAVLPIVDERNSRCRETVIDTNRQLCAGYNNRIVDTYSGDSGGPLLVVEYDDRNRGHFVAAGIVTYENRQYNPSISSGVYTRVGFYLPWIQNIISNV